MKKNKKCHQCDGNKNLEKCPFQGELSYLYDKDDEQEYCCPSCIELCTMEI